VIEMTLRTQTTALAVALFWVLSCGVASSSISNGTTTAAPPPTRRDYDEDIAAMPGRMSFAEALTAARRWRNSSLVVIDSAARNADARQTLADAGIQRAWIGAYRDSATGRGFVWINGVTLANSTYTNWAPGRPRDDSVDTAVALDMASGLWFDLAQGTPTAAVVFTPQREVTETLPLPAFVFPPGVPLKAKVPPWQTAVIVTSSMLTALFVAAAVGLSVWHVKAPLRVDNKKGFAAPPLDEKVDSSPAAPPGVVPPSVPNASSSYGPPPALLLAEYTLPPEPLRYLGEEDRLRYASQLGKPLPEFAPPPEPIPTTVTAPAVPALGGPAAATPPPKEAGNHAGADAEEEEEEEPEEDEEDELDGDGGEDDDGGDDGGGGDPPSALLPKVPLKQPMLLPPAKARSLPPPAPVAAAAPLAARKLPPPAAIGKSSGASGPAGASPVARKLPPPAAIVGKATPKAPPPKAAALPGKGAALLPAARKLPPSAPVGQTKKALGAPLMAGAKRTLPPSRPL
jgi:hypothetical protein